MALRLKIAMIGVRGLPATYGGVERHVEEIGARLVERGHEVTVFVRPGYSGDVREHRGISLVPLPTIHEKHLEAAVHSMLSACRTVGHGYDIAHFHALGPGLFTPIPQALTRAAVVQTVHGLDDERGKWSRFARTMLTAGRRTAARWSDEIVVVSRDLQTTYLTRHGRKSTYIPNGHPSVTPIPPGATLERLGLQAGHYVLFLGRLVREKDPEGLVRAFRALDTDARLVIVGGSSNSDDYVAELQAVAADDPRVVMPGYLFGDDLTEVMSNAALFVQPSHLEGLPITMLEAAAYGLPVVATDIAPHREIIADSGPGHRLVPVGDTGALSAAVAAELADREAGLAGASRHREGVLAHYDWDRATDALEEVYLRAAARRR